MEKDDSKPVSATNTVTIRGNYPSLMPLYTREITGAGFNNRPDNKAVIHLASGVTRGELVTILGELGFEVLD